MYILLLEAKNLFVFIKKVYCNLIFHILIFTFYLIKEAFVNIFYRFYCYIVTFIKN